MKRTSRATTEAPMDHPVAYMVPSHAAVGSGTKGVVPCETLICLARARARVLSCALVGRRLWKTESTCVALTLSAASGEKRRSRQRRAWEMSVAIVSFVALVLTVELCLGG